jgi:hypothetical protein
MKTKSIATLSVVAIVLAGVASSAQAGGGRISPVSGYLTLRPGVSKAGHPHIGSPAYGAAGAAYNSTTSQLTYSVSYKALAGSAFRLQIRSRATGRVYATLCAACHSTPAGHGREGLPVSHIGGQVTVDPDVGFLIASGRTFLEIDTTAYPSGEIGGPLLPPPPVTPGYAHGETPRCC